MRTIRRLYFYLVSFISVLTLVWGITNLIRSLINNQALGNQVNILSAGLAQVLVSIPIFLLHWLVVQKDAVKNEEEKNSLIRAIFLYATQIATLIPAVQNLLALLNRLLLDAVKLQATRAVFGGSQTISDNLIAIVTNLVLAGYFYRILQSEWSTSTEQTNLTDIRRLYRYIWMLYGLIFTVMGVQKVIHYIFAMQHEIGMSGKEELFNGITLLVIGLPLWVFWWQRIQKDIQASEEGQSTLRIIVLYFLSIGGALTTFVSSGWILARVLRVILGEAITIQPFISQLSTPASILVPFLTVWLYFNQHLQITIQQGSEAVRQGAMRRLYRYILAAAGLSGVLYGLIRTLGFVINLLTRRSLIFDTNRSGLATDLAVLLVGLAVWLVHWIKVEAEANLIGADGDHARQSIIRKTYLYITVFACVIGSMVATGILIYTLLQSVLGQTNNRLLIESLLNGRMILVFGVFLAYHLRCLTRDSRSLSKALIDRQTKYQVAALMDANSVEGAALQKAFTRFASDIPLQFVTLDQLNQTVLHDKQALILTGEQLAYPGDFRELLSAYEGKKIILPETSGQLLFLTNQHKPAELYKSCAQAVCALAEGRQVRPFGSSSAWQIVAYIILGLFGLQILLAILGSLLSGID